MKVIALIRTTSIACVAVITACSSGEPTTETSEPPLDPVEEAGAAPICTDLSNYNYAQIGESCASDAECRTGFICVTSFCVDGKCDRVNHPGELCGEEGSVCSDDNRCCTK